TEGLPPPLGGCRFSMRPRQPSCEGSLPRSRREGGDRAMSRFSPRATGASVYSGRVSESWRSALDAAIAGDPRPGLRFAQDASGEGLVLQAALARLGQGAMPELAAIEAAG